VTPTAAAAAGLESLRYREYALLPSAVPHGLPQNNLAELPARRLFVVSRPKASSEELSAATGALCHRLQRDMPAVKREEVAWDKTILAGPRGRQEARSYACAAAVASTKPRAQRAVAGGPEAPSVRKFGGSHQPGGSECFRRYGGGRTRQHATLATARHRVGCELLCGQSPSWQRQ
jgi:hypothetical protein